MKVAAIALAVTAALAATSASAAARVSDVDYLRANRCKGLATGIDGVVDVAALDSFIKSAGASRAPYIVQRAGEEFQRAKREARSEERRARLTAELNGVCQAYLGTNGAVSRQ